MIDLLHRQDQEPAQQDPAALRQTLAPMLDGLSRALGYARALVALYDQQRGCLRGSVGLNVPESIAESLEVSINERDNPLVAALLRGVQSRVDDVRQEPHLDEHHKGLLLEMGITSFVAIPLRPGPAARIEARPAASGSGRSDAVTEERAAAPEHGPSGAIPGPGVVILSKEQPISDEDIEWLLPFANQAGASLARARDAALLRDARDEYAIENEWLWLMINGIADPVVVTDERNDIIRLNRRAETIFRVRPEDSEGKKNAIRMNNFLFTAALSTANLEYGSLGSTGELTLVDPIEGAELWFEVISYPAFHYRLNSTGVVSVLKNVTELRNASEELSQNVQRLQSADETIRLERDRLNLVLRNVPNPILVIDNEDQITQMNQEAGRLFQPAAVGTLGGRREQMIASNNAKFTSFVGQLRAEMSRMKSGELSLIDPATEEGLEMSVTATEIRDDIGAVVGTVSVMQDLTRLRELERRRVEQQLFESEKLAATGRLAASIAHEINNPLEAIKNALYLLLRHIPESDTNHRFLAIATKETERVSRILREMLGFYRPTVATAPTDVNALVGEAEALVEKELRRKGVRLHSVFSPAMPLVKASADQLKQVVLNLLLNAQDAMPGGGDIYVSTQVAQEADPELLLSKAVLIQVRDTGAGIPEDVQPRIFEPFFSTKQTQRGTGLGLWVSQGIVRRHGGTLKVRSRPGSGTTFTVALPIEGPASNA